MKFDPKYGFVRTRATLLIGATACLAALLVLSWRVWHLSMARACAGTPSNLPLTEPWVVPRIFLPISQPNATMNDFWRSIDHVPNGGLLSVVTDDGRHQDWGVSVWHQMYCLSLLRELLVGGSHHRMGHRRGFFNVDKHDMAFSDHHSPSHWVHCLDYLAQVSFDFSSSAIAHNDIPLLCNFCCSPWMQANDLRSRQSYAAQTIHWSAQERTQPPQENYRTSLMALVPTLFIIAARYGLLGKQ